MLHELPAERYQSLFYVPKQKYEKVTHYISYAEFMMGPPSRCRNGRNHRGCLAGYGIQRDAYGRVLEEEERMVPSSQKYPAVWYPPLNFWTGVDE